MMTMLLHGGIKHNDVINVALGKSKLTRTQSITFSNFASAFFNLEG